MHEQIYNFRDSYSFKKEIKFWSSYKVLPWCMCSVSMLYPKHFAVIDQTIVYDRKCKMDTKMWARVTISRLLAYLGNGISVTTRMGGGQEGGGMGCRWIITNYMMIICWLAIMGRHLWLDTVLNRGYSHLTHILARYSSQINYMQYSLKYALRYFELWHLWRKLKHKPIFQLYNCRLTMSHSFIIMYLLILFFYLK